MARRRRGIGWGMGTGSGWPRSLRGAAGSARGPRAARLTASVAVLAAVGLLAPAASATAVHAGAGAAAAAGSPRSVEHVGSGAATATIARDAYGVPSITASSMRGVWYGVGWAQAQDRMVQLELTRRAVEGTLSALFGPSELGQDEFVRTIFYTPAELKAQYESLPSPQRTAIAAFAAGINGYEKYAYANARAQADVPFEFWALGSQLGLTGPYQPAPWTPEDTIAVGNYLARQFGGGGGSELQNMQFLNYLLTYLLRQHDHHASADSAAIFNDARWIDDTTAPTTVPSGPGAAKAAQAALAAAGMGSAGQAVQGTLRSLSWLRKIPPSAIAKAAATLAADRRSILRTGATMKVLAHGGSNAIAVAPSRSADHHALLWGAPQEGFGTPSIDWEEYLHGPGYDAGGMGITGEPFVLIGRNANIAWTTTSEELVDQRIYIEFVNFAANPPTYRWLGKQVPMTAITEQIPVAGQSPVSFTVLRTKDGPVVAADPADGLAFSIRFASWKRETGTLTGFAQLGADSSLSQFRHSMSLITTLHNFLYADRAGNIAYFGDGLLPIQPSFAKVDPRLPAVGDGTQQWQGFVPFRDMPHSVNPRQGFLDNWNTKPSADAYYQQNGGDEYWGAIYRSQRITQMLRASKSVDVAYLERIEHSIGTIDNQDNTRPAARYIIPFLISAYRTLLARHSPLTDPGRHPDLAPAIKALRAWNGNETIGSPAMSIFMNFLEAYERNMFEGGNFGGEIAASRYTGGINFSDASLGLGTYGGLGGMATYNLLYHILAHTRGVLPCQTLCFKSGFAGGYTGAHGNKVLVESLNDAIAILSGTGSQLGQDVPGFGTADITQWGYHPAQDQNWDSLDPIAQAGGVVTHCGTSASQNRSTYMMAVDVGRRLTGQDVLPPGESGFISLAETVGPHFCDQVGLFDQFRYKTMPRS